MKREFSTNYSTFDYPIIISKKHRYIVIASPDFGFQIASTRLDLGEASPEAIGRAVLTVWERVCQKLLFLERNKAAPPKSKLLPLLTRDYLSTREAACLLGISISTLRKLVKSGKLHSSRSLGGHLRFSLEGLSELISEEEDLGVSSHWNPSENLVAVA